MELVEAIWAFCTENVFPNWPYIWPFALACLVSMIIGQLFRRRLWTSSNAKRSKLISFGRETIPAHPLLVGAITGLIWRNPCGVPWSLIASSGYFMASGIVALVGYFFLDKWVEKKFGIDLDELFDEPESIPPHQTMTDVDVPRAEDGHDAP